MIFTLIGMPGCGKSCMGRALASKLKFKLIDVDKMIERRVGQKLQTIIDEQGVEYFRKLEEETLLSIYSTGAHAIVSTGGSAVYSKAGMEHLKSLGKIVYLYCSYDTISARLGDFSKRGIVFKPGQDLRGLYNERTPLYKKYSDIVINCDGIAYPRYQHNAIRAIKSAIAIARIEEEKRLTKKNADFDTDTK